jgi:hypothetical protein
MLLWPRNSGKLFILKVTLKTKHIRLKGVKWNTVVLSHRVADLEKQLSLKNKNEIERTKNSMSSLYRI